MVEAVIRQTFAVVALASFSARWYISPFVNWAVPGAIVYEGFVPSQLLGCQWGLSQSFAVLTPALRLSGCTVKLTGSAIFTKPAMIVEISFLLLLHFFVCAVGEDAAPRHLNIVHRCIGMQRARKNGCVAEAGMALRFIRDKPTLTLNSLSGCFLNFLVWAWSHCD